MVVETTTRGAAHGSVKRHGRFEMSKSLSPDIYIWEAREWRNGAKVANISLGGFSKCFKLLFSSLSSELLRSESPFCVICVVLHISKASLGKLFKAFTKLVAPCIRVAR